MSTGKDNKTESSNIEQELIALKDNPEKMQEIMADPVQRKEFLEKLKRFDPEHAKQLQEAFGTLEAIERGDDSHPEAQRIKNLAAQDIQHKKRFDAYKQKVDREVDAVSHELAPEMNKMYLLGAASAAVAGGLTYALVPPVGGLMTTLAVLGAGGIGAVAGTVAGNRMWIKPKMAPHIQRWESEGEALDNEGKALEQEAARQQDVFVQKNLNKLGVGQQAGPSFAERYASEQAAQSGAVVR